MPTQQTHPLCHLRPEALGIAHELAMLRRQAHDQERPTGTWRGDFHRPSSYWHRILTRFLGDLPCEVRHELEAIAMIGRGGGHPSRFTEARDYCREHDHDEGRHWAEKLPLDEYLAHGMQKLGLA